MLQRLDFSARGRLRVGLWTVFGTLGCVIAAMTLDSATFGSMAPTERMRSLFTDVVVTSVIAGPFIFFFASKVRELAIAHHLLAVAAATDSLTDVLNRGAFTTIVDAYLRRVDAEQKLGALLVIDVDHFKRINDSLGHDQGDEALRLIAQTIKGVLRSVDLVGRLGGEEFGVFLPGATADRARGAAERIRLAVNNAEFLAGGARRDLSVSVGGASFSREVMFTELYRAADQRLYEAKQAGRNRVVFLALDEGRAAAA